LAFSTKRIVSSSPPLLPLYCPRTVRPLFKPVSKKITNPFLNQQKNMGDQFEDAYERFHEKIQAAHKHLNVNKLKNAQKSLNDCGKQIKNMEREARHSDGVERRRLLEKIKKSKAMLQKTKQEYQQIAAGGGSPSRNTRNNELYGNPAQGNPNQSFNAMSDSNKTRARILENSSTQKETDDLLLDSRRIANETREIGTAALNSIEDQTDMLLEAKDSVNQTHLETKRAGQLLNTM
jgi:membrane-associated HD superfamily phosphohydrolase